MILHICSDDKFTDYVINLFEEVNPNGNLYYILKDANNDSLKFVKTKHSCIILSNKSEIELGALVLSLNRYSSVILHNFIDGFKVNLVLRASSEIHFHWMSWGADLYNDVKLFDSCLGDLTYNYLNKKRNINWKIDKFVEYNFPYIHNIYCKNSFIPIYSYRKAIGRMKSCSTVVPLEMPLVRKYTNKNLQYLPFKYATIESLITEDLDSLCDSCNILLGNSATLTNNHFEAIDIIASTVLKSKNVIVPLSYGDSNYAKDVVTYAKEKISEKEIVPLLSFMPLQEYVELLKSCGIVIMNHVRQQAMGNIIISIWMGAKVYFNPRSIVYQYLKDLGLIVYSIDELGDYENTQSFILLAEHNRKILYELYSQANVLKETKQLVDYLQNKKK